MTDPGLGVLGHLLDASHDLAPDDLVAAVNRAGQALDADDVAIYLVDYEQTLLVPLPDGTDRTPLEIDTTLAGRAFAAIAVQEADVASGRRLWLPLLDGAERLGILGLTLPSVDDALRVRCTWLATLVAELLMTKGQYTDTYFLARRRKPMGVAAEMQWQLLPPLTLVTPRVVIAGLLEPAYEVAGDAFDYALNGDTAHLAVIDPVGHDLTASVLAAVTVGSYRHSRRVGLDLADTYAVADQAIATQFGGERFVTGQLAQLDCATGRLQWLNAGHPLPLLARRAKVVDTLACHPVPPLGLGFGQPEIATAALEPGDRVLFHTNGVTEGRNLAGEPFGEARLADLLVRETLAGQPAAETMRRLAHTILAHQGRTPRDDATMNLSSQRSGTQNTWPDRLQPDRRGRRCGTHSGGEVASAAARHPVVLQGAGLSHGPLEKRAGCRLRGVDLWQRPRQVEAGRSSSLKGDQPAARSRPVGVGAVTGQGDLGGSTR